MTNNGVIQFDGNSVQMKDVCFSGGGGGCGGGV